MGQKPSACPLAGVGRVTPIPEKKPRRSSNAKGSAGPPSSSVFYRLAIRDPGPIAEQSAAEQNSHDRRSDIRCEKSRENVSHLGTNGEDKRSSEQQVQQE